jgi:hypothetical protein
LLSNTCVYMYMYVCVHLYNLCITLARRYNLQFYRAVVILGTLNYYIHVMCTTHHVSAHTHSTQPLSRKHIGGKRN